MLWIGNNFKLKNNYIIIIVWAGLCARTNTHLLERYGQVNYDWFVNQYGELPVTLIEFFVAGTCP